MVRVHFDGWPSRWDEDIDLKSGRIAPLRRFAQGGRSDGAVEGVPNPAIADEYIDNEAGVDENLMLMDMQDDITNKHENNNNNNNNNNNSNNNDKDNKKNAMDIKKAIFNSMWRGGMICKLGTPLSPLVENLPRNDLSILSFIQVICCVAFFIEV